MFFQDPMQSTNVSPLEPFAGALTKDESTLSTSLTHFQAKVRRIAEC